MRMLPFILLMSFTCLFAGCINTQVNQKYYSQDQGSGENLNVVRYSEVKWKQLNPKRGDKSPKAANLWGGRLVPGASGFLVEFVDGFSSPPHIHNISYRGVVISGLIHNDDPGAEVMWMPTGSFWTQPAGEVHITSCKGGCLAYIEIDDGPFLVSPAVDAFDNGERPVNIDKSNLVWLKKWDNNSEGEAKITYLWGSPEEGHMNGTMLKLPPGFTGNIGDESTALQVVVISGQLSFMLADERNKSDIGPGSYLSLEGDSRQMIRCKSRSGCLVYVRSREY